VVLVDTSVWINHLRTSNEYLSELLIEEKVLVHPFVIGELACGSMKNRLKILGYLRELPHSLESDFDETMDFLTEKNLFGKGIGWVDASLLLSTRLSKAKLWSIEQRLRTLAIALKINYSPLSER
jgi:predicted nucleic acid-binding protein